VDEGKWEAIGYADGYVVFQCSRCQAQVTHYAKAHRWKVGTTKRPPACRCWWKQASEVGENQPDENNLRAEKADQRWATLRDAKIPEALSEEKYDFDRWGEGFDAGLRYVLGEMTALETKEGHVTDTDAEDFVMSDAKDWAEHGTMPPDRRGLLRLLLGRIERAADQHKAEVTSHNLIVERTSLALARAKDEYAQLAELLFGEAEYEHDDVHRRLAAILNDLQSETEAHYKTRRALAESEQAAAFYRRTGDVFLIERDALRAVLDGMEKWLDAQRDKAPDDRACCCPTAVMTELAALKRKHAIGGVK